MVRSNAEPGGLPAVGGLSWLFGQGVAAVDGVDDPAPGSFEFGRVAETEVAFDRGEVHAEAVIGEDAGDPPREVTSGQMVGEDGRVAVAKVAAELLNGGGGGRQLAGCMTMPPRAAWLADIANAEIAVSAHMASAR